MFDDLMHLQSVLVIRRNRSSVFAIEAIRNRIAVGAPVQLDTSTSPMRKHPPAPSPAAIMQVFVRHPGF